MYVCMFVCKCAEVILCVCMFVRVCLFVCVFLSHLQDVQAISTTSIGFLKLTICKTKSTFSVS